MRRLLAILLAAVPSLLTAQQRDSASQQRLPRDIRREVMDRWNAGAAVRSSGRFDLDEGRQITGDVAVQEGPVIIAGHVTGSVLAINADVEFRPSGRIDGDLLVIGGAVRGRNAESVAGEIRIYRQPLAYHVDGERIVVDRAESPDDEDGWWHRVQGDRAASWSDPIRISESGPYNRVEGLPVQIGPTVYEKRSWCSFRLDVSAILRSGTSFGTKNGNEDIGHNARAEFRTGPDGGQRSGLALGGRLFNAVDGVETWQLSDLETALASFVFHRDYRDYFQRHGAAAYTTFFARPDVSLTASLSDERWGSRNLIGPFTLFHDAEPWRPNPSFDEGRLHVFNATARADTRTDPIDPWSGWYAVADVERGSGDLNVVAPTTDGRATVPGPITYSRGFLDLRRYNRLSRQSQLNMRVVFGGTLSGDPLPLERRLSVDGPGALPGYGFREERTGPDVGTCSLNASVAGRPVECDRIALAQIEYRGNLHFVFGGDWDDSSIRYGSSHGDADWVLFADAGRGWLVGDSASALTYSRNQLPPLSTFRSDVGLGVEVGTVGVYAAKSMAPPIEPLRFFVRLRRRF